MLRDNSETLKNWNKKTLNFNNEIKVIDMT